MLILIKNQNINKTIEVNKEKSITCDVRMKGSKEHNKQYLIDKNSSLHNGR